MDATTEALNAAREVLQEGVGIWLAWLQAGGLADARDATALAAAIGDGAVPTDGTAQQQARRKMCTRTLYCTALHWQQHSLGACARKKHTHMSMCVRASTHTHNTHAHNTF